MQSFRRAVLRGIGVVLPPLLTIVILLWIANSVQLYVLEPVETVSRRAIVWCMNKTRTDFPDEAVPVESENAPGEDPRIKYDGLSYVALANGQWIPDYIRDEVARDPGDPVPYTGKEYYNRYVDNAILTPAVVIPVFSAGFILAMYLLGKFLAAGVGRFLWNSLEQVITRVPIIRSVYSSIKQVTDFFFSENEIEFTRVVAVEYPRRGIWSIGFVTGESMPTIRAAANEPVMSVLMPTSPIPGTGFTVTVRKSEVVDLDIPVEQALQFVVSCGVVVPDDEMSKINAKIATATADRPEPFDNVVATQS